MSFFYFSENCKFDDVVSRFPALTGGGNEDVGRGGAEVPGSGGEEQTSSGQV